MGATRSQVQRVFLLQGAVVGALGSLLGVALAATLIDIFTRFVRGSDGLPLFAIALPPALALQVRQGVVRFEHVDFAYDPARPILHDVCFEIPAGKTVAVVGPSGAGKSTLLGVISGLVRPTRGRVALGAEVWVDTAARVALPIEARHCAYLFQALALFPHLDALANVAYAVPRAVPRAERRARAAALLAKVGVAHLGPRRPRTYSGGEAQRVALARALAMAPSVVLLDEPFSALDRALKIQLAGLVRGLVDELGVPLVYVTHSTGEARALADRAIRLEHGKVVAEGSVDDGGAAGAAIVTSGLGLAIEAAWVRWAGVIIAAARAR